MLVIRLHFPWIQPSNVNTTKTTKAGPLLNVGFSGRSLCLKEFSHQCQTFLGFKYQALLFQLFSHLLHRSQSCRNILRDEKNQTKKYLKRRIKLFNIPKIIGPKRKFMGDHKRMFDLSMREIYYNNQVMSEMVVIVQMEGTVISV